MITSAVVIFLLILLNGIFAMTELAVVSAKRPLLTLRAEAGNKGAKAALELLANSSMFFSTTQTGITLIATLSGAYGGATLAEPLALKLLQYPSLEPYAEEIAFTLVVAVITYLSLIIGELVPKQFALLHAERIACWVSRPMQWLAVAAKPVVKALDASNRLVLRLLGISTDNANQVTAEEVKAVIAEGTESGALDSQEQSMIESVLRLDELSIKRAMTPRQDVVWIDTADRAEDVAVKVKAARHSRYLLCDGSFDHIVGIVTAKDILAGMAQGGTADLLEIARQPVVLPDSASVMTALEHFRKSTSNIALVVDEYGGFEGIVTFKDILEAIVGTLPEGEDYVAPHAIQREDGTWLVDGLMPLHEVEAVLGLKSLEEDGAEYHTLAGFLMHHLQRIPTEGERIDWQGARFEVMDMDGHRVDKLLVTLPGSNDAKTGDARVAAPKPADRKADT